MHTGNVGDVIDHGIRSDDVEDVSTSGNTFWKRSLTCQQWNALSIGNVRRLVGNGMHTGNVGDVIDRGIHSEDVRNVIIS